MITQECVSLDNYSQWQASLTGIKHTFFHTWENCYAMSLTNRLKTYLYHLEMENVRIVCPISERNFENSIDIFTPYGFSGFVGNSDINRCLENWFDFVKNRGYVCGYIGLNPIFDNNTYLPNSNPIHYNNIYVLDLTLTESELFTNLSTNRKRQIKKWQKEPHEYFLEKQELTSFFLTNYHDFMQNKNAGSSYNFSIETLSFLFSLDNIFLVGAGSGTRLEAVSVFAYTPYVGDFLFNVSLPEGKQHSVALLWYGIKHLKSLQIPLMNLGGGVSENDSLAEFKERFGAKKLPLRCLKQIYNQEIYQKLCQQVNVDSNDLTGYFPAYRKAILKR